MLNGKTLLLTGGTGSFSQAFIPALLQAYPGLKNIVIFSRDKAKQKALAACFPEAPFRFISGDMADPQKVKQACRNTDMVVHTAAVRLVPAAEADPWEAVRTNVIGTHHLIEAALEENVSQILALSTDMASLANNAYGATKMLAEKLWIDAYKRHPRLKTTVVRFGNIFGSSGTVIPFFIKKAKEEGILPVTDPRMTRFMATREQCAQIALRILGHSLGGEIIAPKIPSYHILTIARAVDEKAGIRTIGLRPGEKLFEEMITRYESFHTIESQEAYIIVPPYADKTEYCRFYAARPVPVGFEYNSENNPRRISLEEMKKMIRTL